LIDRILDLQNLSLLLLGYRKSGQNAIYIELVYEGMELCPRESVIYNFLSCEVLDLQRIYNRRRLFYLTVNSK